MRIADRVLSCVVFLGSKKGSSFVPSATGFLVSTTYKEGFFSYLVTCQHAVDGPDPLYVRLNRRGGIAEVLDEPILPSFWRYHPEAETRYVDLAVVPINLTHDLYDVAHIKIEEFCNRKRMQERDLGVGDELFYPGLFPRHSGTERNLPVMRSATLARMPIEPIDTESGPVVAYLVEGRSVGGHSGSPIFANFLAPRMYYADKLISPPLPGEPRYQLIGMVRSYLTADKYVGDKRKKEDDFGPNSGISTVVPAWEIMETINQDELVLERQEKLAAHRKISGDVPVSVDRPKSEPRPTADNASHKEAFSSLVSAAARKKPRADRT